MHNSIACVVLVLSTAVLAAAPAGTIRQPSEYALRMKEADELVKDGGYEKAEEIYSSVLERNHRDVDALMGRGLCRMKIAGRTGEALEDFRKVMVLTPGYIDAHVGAATCLKRLGNAKDAQKVLDEASKAAGDDEKKIGSLATAAWSFGFWDFARSISPSYKDKVAPEELARKEYVRTLAEARKLRIGGFVDRAEGIYRAILALNPRDVDAIAGLGFCRLRHNEGLDEALGLFLKVIELSPEYVDAYIGAAACYSRKDQRSEMAAILERCREACRSDEAKMRYLAITAWREGHFPLARSIDRDYPPLPDRETLTENPTTVRLTTGHSHLAAQEDWYETMVSASHRLRPDITVGVDYDQWWRYGTRDFNAGVEMSYRYNYAWSFNYDYEFSDNGGFLAEQRHDATVNYKLYRRLYVYAGPRLARYDGEWSRRGKGGLMCYWKEFFADAYYSSGRDTAGENVESSGVSVGYDHELRYGLAAGYSSGKETVDFLRGGEWLFRSDDVESFFARCRFYLSKQAGVSLHWLEEHRNGEFFRREISTTVLVSF